MADKKTVRLVRIEDRYYRTVDGLYEVKQDYSLWSIIRADGRVLRQVLTLAEARTAIWNIIHPSALVAAMADKFEFYQTEAKKLEDPKGPWKERGCIQNVLDVTRMGLFCLQGGNWTEAVEHLIEAQCNLHTFWMHRERGY